MDDINVELKVKIHAFIADAPARALALNINQYNGQYGCIMCLDEGRNIAAGRGNHMVYPYNKDMTVRTKEVYNAQVKASKTLKCLVEGVKGYTFI